ncbi:TIR domain-containing protein [Brucella sp.]|uniref:TIR domain-containing protein n=1 Tax=Brucella sp. TaxID=52132 RepID=UPI0028A9A747|nr:TIR domain-containing protein [Brucella sp.]
MNHDDLVNLLQTNGYNVKSCDRLSNDKGWAIKCTSGEIINLYDTGKLVVQGKNQAAINTLLGQPIAAPVNGTTAATGIQPTNSSPRDVFVVYGHDSIARTELEAMLRRWGLNPIILDQLTSGGQTIIEKLEGAAKTANFAVVLATPDDEGHRAGHEEEKAFRARQNVVLELGMMLTKLGRDRVAVLMRQQENMERPSDIQGVIYIPFKDEVGEAALALAKEINEKGINIDLKRV